MTTIRLLSYNIRSMRDDRAALARVINRLEPDVVCVQEAPRFAFWLRKRRWLAREVSLGLAVRRRPAGLELYAGRRTALLHRGHRLLSSVPGLHRRGLVMGLFDVGGVRLVVASVHLDLLGGPRLRHAEEIVKELERARERFDAPVVLAGDINEEPGGAAWDFLAEHFQDGYLVAPAGEGATYSSSAPRTRIDGVFADPGIEVLSCGVPDEPELLADYPDATDHRPILAELRVR
ncbi:endonuclease/exonuclease/phosphatase family protein [Actinoallomurus bryophytorum]|uniref:Endonuclease/exonuclease/phosphatase family metal-dependent hydrolase n=1 Tax=Actinoallomurus bryophytorum TaxID=1490222 RepID=A0A543CC92_9ACTN|nr:endonuclease/exonuclease/phosphatase family protein [Actinoallomurus bryophytorum]TQL94696.1 endonuclease/exonuclease/phosphatase family metal-dependent hydrolase [Actinoallomurus bryophytorum]